MAREFYVKQDVLLVVPQPRGEELRVTIGTRSNGDRYVDVRTWYQNRDGEMAPGKGIGKKDVNGLWDEIAKAIIERDERIGQAPVVYDPLRDLYIE